MLNEAFETGEIKIIKQHLNNYVTDICAQKLVSKTAYLKGFSLYLKSLPGLECDFPLVCKYFAHLMYHLIENQGLLQFNDIVWFMPDDKPANEDDYVEPPDAIIKTIAFYLREHMDAKSEGGI